MSSNLLSLVLLCLTGPHTVSGRDFLLANFEKFNYGWLLGGVWAAIGTCFDSCSALLYLLIRMACLWNFMKTQTKKSATAYVAMPKWKQTITGLILAAFLVSGLNICTVLAVDFSLTQPSQLDDGELLYNGIQLPKQWPPSGDAQPVLSVPYLKNLPAVIPINVGRQLFVDDFLIEKADNLTRTFHHATPYTNNPILFPQTALELNGGTNPCATLFQDGVCYDPQDKLFKMWYHAGWFDGTAYATSTNGLYWVRPSLDVVPGSPNRILPVQGHGARDGSSIWLDQFTTNVNERFKMFIYERSTPAYSPDYPGQIYVSPDGIHWSGPTYAPGVGKGDNTSIFYNPFRKKWVFSVRVNFAPGGGRSRAYRECDDLVLGARWTSKDIVSWASTDANDLPDPLVVALMPPGHKPTSDYGKPPQLYNVDAVGYESLMLGVFGVHHGPENNVCDRLKMPKYTDLELAFSRDGFHWDRPDRTYFLATSHNTNTWDRGYLHSATTICTIVGDKLYFYYGAFSGQSPSRINDMYAGGATGVAFLRRDGFASMDAGRIEGTLTTRPVTFKGKYLFVNLSAPAGKLRVEVLDKNNQVINPFTVANCVTTTTDSTRTQVHWNGANDLSSISGRKVKLRFHLLQGQLYGFWVTPDSGGASYGYVAAGGPGFHGPIDN